jgi:hypothetical protein
MVVFKEKQFEIRLLISDFSDMDLFIQSFLLIHVTISVIFFKGPAATRSFLFLHDVVLPFQQPFVCLRVKKIHPVFAGWID